MQKHHLAVCYLLYSIVLFRSYMTISRPKKYHSKHIEQLRIGHFLSSGTAKDFAITWSNYTITAILPYVKLTNNDA